MGAVLYHETFDGKLTEDQVRKQYLSRRDDMEYEHGTDPYNGTWSTLDDALVIHKELLENHQAASDFIDQRCEKRGAAHAVKFKDVRSETTKEPTFRGKKWHEQSHIQFSCPDGSNFSTRSVVRIWNMNGPNEYAAADSLPPTVQLKLVAAARAWSDKKREYDLIQAPLAALAQRLAAPKLEVGTADFANMKSLRKRLLKAYASLTKAADKLCELDKKYAEKLYATAAVDHGTKWLVGGLCAE